MSKDGLTVKEATDILFPLGFCVSKFNSDRCIIPASMVIEEKGYCEYHGNALKAHIKLWETIDALNQK
jgi:hypothetical protein